MGRGPSGERDRERDGERERLAEVRLLERSREAPRRPGRLRPEVRDPVHAAIRGEATHDSNFNANGDGCDEVTYRVAVGPAKEPLAVEVELLYQSVPPEAVARLRKSRGPASKGFIRLYDKADKTPEVVHHSRIEL